MNGSVWVQFEADIGELKGINAGAESDDWELPRGAVFRNCRLPTDKHTFCREGSQWSVTVGCCERLALREFEPRPCIDPCGARKQNAAE